MLQVFVSPNPLAPSTSIEVSWSFDADEIPDSVIVMEFDASGNLITSTGQIAPIPGGPVLFSALKPDTTYFYQFCTVTNSDAGVDQDCGSGWNQYSGTTASGPPPPPPTSATTTLQITAVRAYPNHLAQTDGVGTWSLVPNAAIISWLSSAPVIEIEVDNSSGVSGESVNESGSSFPKSSGSDGVGPRPVGVEYLVEIRGAISISGTTTDWTDFSPVVQFTDPGNTNSPRCFLKASEISGGNGIRAFFPKNVSVGLRTQMGV